MFALVKNGNPVEFPYGLRELRRDHPDLDFPDDYDLHEAADYGVLPVADATVPAVGEGQTLDENMPVWSNGELVRNYVVHDWLMIEAGIDYVRVIDGEIHFPYTLNDLRASDLAGVVFGKADRVNQMDGEWGMFLPEDGDVPEPGPNQWVKPDGVTEYAPLKFRKAYSLQEYTPEELEALETRLLNQIDSQAGEFRQRFITSVPGQAQTYVEKEREALAYQSDPEGSYPFLTAEATATGSTVATVAALVAGTAAAWRQLGAAIEGRRMGAKQAVKDAATYSGKLAAAEVDWEGLLP